MSISQRVALVCLFVTTSLSFAFKQLTITPTLTSVGSTTQYTFLYQRSVSSSNGNSAWSVQQVPADSNITITFPSEYTLTSPTCVSVSVMSSTVTGYTCTTSGNTVTIQGAILNPLFIDTVEIKIGNIVNPVPALVTGSFLGTIGIDTSAPDGGVQLTAATFDSCSITFDTAYVNQTSTTLVVTIDPKNALDSGSTLLVDFSGRWTNDIVTTSRLPITTNMICVNYSSSVTSAPTCAGNNVQYSITVSNMLTASTSTSFAVGIKQMTSPPTLQPSDAITITSYSSDGYEYDTCTVYPSGLIANTFTSVVINSIETFTVNTQVGFTMLLTLADWCNNGDDLQIIFPSEITPTAFLNASGSGNYNTSGSSVSGQTMNILQSRTISKIYNKASVYTVNVYKIRAPPSTKTTSSITVKILRNGFEKMVGTTTMKAVASALTGAVAATLTTVNKVTTYRINITTIDPLTSAGMIKITFPSTITPTLTSSCATLSGTSVRTNPTCAYDSTTNTITFTNLNSSSSNIPAQTFRFTILSVQNGPSIGTSGSFTAYTYYTNDINDLVSQGNIAGITATIDVLDASKVSVVPSSYIVSDTIVTYTINFVTGNNIPQSGFVQITIPTAVTLSLTSLSSYCKLAINNGSFFSTTCAGSNTGSSYYVNFSTIAQSTNRPAGTTISLRIQTLLTNPGDTSIVSSFTIKTYHSDGFAIQQLTSGITVQMTTPSTMTSTAVTRSSETNSNVATTYTFKLKQTPALPANCRLTIGFPSVLIITGNLTCASLTGTSLSFTQSSNSIQVLLTSAVATGVQFGVVITGIGNPPSFAPFVAPTFSFTTKSSDRILSYAIGSHTSTLQTSTPSNFGSISGTYSSLIYGEATNLQITVTPSSRLVPSYLLVTIPGTFTVSTLSCTSWSCLSISSNVIRINNITSITQVTFTITGITAPLGAITDTVLVNSFDSNSFKIDENTASPILFTAACTLPCRTCSATNSTSCLTCYTNTAIDTSVYYYSPQATCYTICPAGTYSDSSSGLRCLDCNSLCKTCSGSATNCTSCYSNNTFIYLFVNSSLGTCRTQCPSTYYADTAASPIQCVACTGRCLTCTSATQCLSCVDPFYFTNSSCQTSCPSGTTIANNVTNQCDNCSSVCATCSGTIDNCIGCSGSAAIQDGTCVEVCSAPKVKYNGICSSCSSICYTCSLNYDNCTSCNNINGTLPYLYGTTCLALCPELYYQSLADGKCILCSTLNIGCDNCTSTSTCGTCNWNQGYVFLSNRCYSTTPTGYYNSSGYAIACDSATSNCLTCTNFANNCTACVTLNLQGNTCVSQCSSGFVGINKVCTACTSNCRTCSNLQSNCTSCTPNLSPQVYLSNFQCITTCPDYTYANVTNNECTACTNNCQKCTSISTCTTCLVGFNRQNTSCVVNCSYGYLGVNRICQACTSNCAACVQSLSLCTACLTGFYFVSSTSSCVLNCPTGLYSNPATGNCTGCSGSCDTCSVTSSNCTSCLNGLALFNYTCVTNCTDGYYLLNSQCNACNVNCSTCSSATVCITCKFGFYFYSGNCVDQCPSTFPVTTTGSCTDCTDTNCLVCDSLDQCSSCNFPTLVLAGHCRDTCPTNYTSNTTHCNYNPINQTNNTNNTNTTSNQTLNQTLSSSNIFPVPFTIGATFIGVACIMSKFQHSYTFMSGSLYSMWSLLEWGSLGVGAYLYLQSNIAKISFNSQYIQAFVFAAAVGLMYLFNLLALFAQNCYLRGQASFKRWLEKEGGNSCFYTFASIIGLFFTHKFKNIMFCKLFGFDIFKARLDSIQSFKIFNILSFLSFIPSGAILFSTSYMIYKHHISDQELMAYIDILVLTVACIVLAVLNSRKGDDFFEEKDQDGFIINKRIVQSDSIMQEAITPFMAEEHEDRGNMAKNNTYETQRKFRSYNTESISDQSSYQYIQPPKDVHDISIQAAPVLHDFSRIDFYNDQQMSDMSMFKKVDRSVNMTKQLHANEVSIQNDMNVFEQKEVSIQYNPMQEDVSIQNQPIHDEMGIQHQVDVHDISLQNVVNVDDQGVQMSRHEQDHSIQVGVLVNNASIQYSAKPVFENLSEDFMDSDEQEGINNNNTQLQQQFSKQSDQKPAETPKGLKAQLELDVDERLRRKQQEMQLERQQEIARKKEQMLRKFQQQQENKNILSKEKELQRNDNYERVNKIYNNDNSRLDGSSLLDSDANIMVHFRKNTKKEIQQKEQEEIQPRNPKQDKQRVQSAKTQKQFIDMLQNNQPGLDVESSMSFNVTRDLDDANSNKNKKVKNVVYEEQDKNMDSGDEDIMMEESPERNKRKQVYILQNDTGEQIPSIEKSRSTNFLSTNGGRRPPLPYRTNSKNVLDESSRMQNSIPENDDDEIINHPIKAVAKHGLPNPYYREQQLQYVNKTNLNQFDRRKNNPVSAHQFSTNNKIPYSQSDQLFPSKQSKQRESKQNPLPLPKIQRLKSQQSNHSNDNQRLYRLNSRKALMEDRKLEFDEEERIYNMNSDQEQFQSRLPKVISSESRMKNTKSMSKFAQRDTSYEKPVHRELLGKDRFVDRTEKFLQKQSKKAESTKKRIEQMEVMLQRPNISSNRGYLKQTHSSIDKKKKSELEKVYMNNPFEKKF